MLILPWVKITGISPPHDRYYRFNIAVNDSTAWLISEPPTCLTKYNTQTTFFLFCYPLGFVSPLLATSHNSLLF